METILHRIKAHLYENALTKDNSNDLIARVSAERSLSVKDICESAAGRGGADISAPAMEHGVNLWLKEMAYQLCDGYSVNTGWFTAGVHIKGVFDSPNEHFNPEKHTLLFEFQQGLLLRRELESVGVDILGMAETGMAIFQVTDVKTGSVNELLTPDRNLRISGHKIKIAGDNDANGVYFINQASMKRIPVDVSDIVTNNPSELIVVIPALEKGTYKLEVTTQFGNNSKTLLNEPRTTVFDKLLSVT
jgi:hypothetical protein